ncbi:MAG: YraN family protein [Saprospiraceae bacterium]|nr:YraN family protein [Saprospiraceae bacterium]
MPIQHKHGQKGEELAAAHLAEQGLVILERNWRVGQYEIDIIAQDQGVLVFVEVKTRSHGQYGPPEEMITVEQWDRIAHTGGLYMRKIDYDWEVRFDIVAVRLFPDGAHSVRHFQNVFWPWS